MCSLQPVGTQSPMDFAGMRAGFVGVLMSPDPVLVPWPSVSWVGTAGLGACPALPHPIPLHLLLCCLPTLSLHLTAPWWDWNLEVGELARKEECSSGSSQALMSPAPCLLLF